MAKSVVKLSGAGVTAIWKSPKMVAELHRRAEMLAAAARAAAPVDTGAYRAGIVVRDEMHGTMAVSRVYATDPKSQIIEARDRTLGTSLDAARG